LLAFDQLVAASERGLRTADPDKTTVVGSTAATPTGEMITHLEVELPTSDALIKRIAGRSRSQAQFWADAAALTEDLFGSATSANIFVVGMAVQAGCLPIASEKVEEAIELNGVAVEANKSAFRWGRALIAMPSRVEEAREACRPEAVREMATARIELADVYRRRIGALGLTEVEKESVERFASELALWGSVADLGRYLDVLDRVAGVEERTHASGRRVTLAVARNLYKLMAYKDEYEVARLMNDPEGNAAATEAAVAGERIAWKLHPPFLRALGLSRKITIGIWARPAIRVLAKGKILRGTPVDPFGYARVRRLERALPGEYVEAIDRALPRLQAGNVADIVALAELPDLVRGYEGLKLERIAEYRARLDRELARVSDS